jgi:hypothetical protein
MTETHEETIAEALALIDTQLGTLNTRNLVPSAEVTDVLLDLRALLAGQHDVPEPVGAGQVG